MSYLVILLVILSQMSFSQEYRAAEFNINFGDENISDFSEWYLWSEDQSGLSFQRSFDNFYNGQDLHIEVRTDCQLRCELEFRSGDAKEVNSVYSNGIQVPNLVLLNFGNLGEYPYEVTLFVRAGVHPYNSHNLVHVYKKDFAKTWVDQLSLRVDDGKSIGKSIKIPISQGNQSEEVSFELRGQRPFMLSAVTLSVFKERKQVGTYMRLVERDETHLAYNYNGPYGRKRSICAVYHGRDVLLGIYIKRNDACQVIHEDIIWPFKNFKLLEWQPYYRWLPVNIISKLTPVTLPNSYGPVDHRYCRVGHKQGHWFGRIKKSTGCQYISQGQVEVVGEGYEILFRK